MGENASRWPAFAMALALAGCGKTREPPPIRWHARFEPGCDASRAQNKPVMMLFHADWDVVSAELGHGAFADREVRALVDRSFVAVKIDRTRTYMRSDDLPDDDDEVREYERARERFRPWQSKYGTLLLLSPGCEKEVDRIEAWDPPFVAKRLRAAAR